jgi:hypothetical protein
MSSTFSQIIVSKFFTNNLLSRPFYLKYCAKWKEVFSTIVIPAKVGIQVYKPLSAPPLDTGSRHNDQFINVL